MTPVKAISLVILGILGVILIRRRWMAISWKEKEKTFLFILYVLMLWLIVKS